MKYLNENEVIALNQYLMAQYAGNYGLQDPHGLNSVVNLVHSGFGDQLFYPTLTSQAAYLMQKISKKHLFLDGNKRTAYLVTKWFLNLNGYQLSLPVSTAKDLILKITTNPDDDQTMDQLDQYLKSVITKIN